MMSIDLGILLSSVDIMLLRGNCMWLGQFKMES